MQTWFDDVEGFVVNVSTHGYFAIHTPKVPIAKFSTILSVLHEGAVHKLGHGIEYMPYYDEINVDLEYTEDPVKEFVRARLDELKAKERECIKQWKEWQETVLPLGGFGDDILPNDIVIMDGRKIKIIYYDLKHNELIHEHIDDKFKGTLFSSGLQGPGWKRTFTKCKG